MESHDTHLITRSSKRSQNDNYYKSDSCGNLLIDSIDDLLYEKYVSNKKKKKNNYPNTKQESKFTDLINPKKNPFRRK